MAERPEQDTGPRVRATVYLPPDLWDDVQVDALRAKVNASAIIAELLTSHLALNDDERAAVAARSVRWVRPKGGAARGDGDTP